MFATVSAMSFGFSVGDFIAALELVGTVINALRESGGSGPQYRELVDQLYSLETALLRVKQLEFEDEQHSEYIALRQAASQCQRTIRNFWMKIKKYQKHLRSGGSTSTLKDCWMKVKWTMFETEDVARLKTDLAAHTQSINIIMAALQLNNIKNQDRKRNAEYRSIYGAIQDATFLCMAKLAEMTASMTSGILQGQEILQNTARIMATNIRVFQVVCSIHNIITQIPCQVERQQPVYMIDALGRAAPFYLEFIRSREALQAVLKINFANIPSGLRKINNGEFVLLEATSKRQVDISKDWDACFMPGQRIEMRMIFHRQTRRLNSCPSCSHESKAYKEEDVDCVKCGVTFRRVIQIEEPPTDPKAEPRKKVVKDLRELSSALSYDAKAPEGLGPPRPPETAYDEIEDLQYYRRINVVQRQRRVVWESDIVPDGPDLKIDKPIQQAEANELEPTMERYYGEDLSDDSDTDDLATLGLGESINVKSFCEILEMDDSDEDIEREFSRSIILGGLEAIEHDIRQIEDSLNTNNNEMHEIHGLAHSLKGRCHIIGLSKVENDAKAIQFIASDSFASNSSRSVEEMIHDVKQLMGGMKDAFVDAKQKIRTFYREPQEETVW